MKKILVLLVALVGILGALEFDYAKYSVMYVNDGGECRKYLQDDSLFGTVKYLMNHNSSVYGEQEEKYVRVSSMVTGEELHFYFFNSVENCKDVAGALARIK